MRWWFFKHKTRLENCLIDLITELKDKDGAMRVLKNKKTNTVLNGWKGIYFDLKNKIFKR